MLLPGSSATAATIVCEGIAEVVRLRAQIAEIQSLHSEKHGVHVRRLYSEDLDDARIVEEPYVICDYDKTDWPCRTQVILSRGSQGTTEPSLTEQQRLWLAFFERFKATGSISVPVIRQWWSEQIGWNDPTPCRNVTRPEARRVSVEEAITSAEAYVYAPRTREQFDAEQEATRG